MSQPSPDAKAVVRAAEQLTTQVRRIADALTHAAGARQSDFALTPDAPDDDATTPATTCSAQYHRFDPIRQCIRAAHHDGISHTDENGFHWSDTVAVYPVDTTVRIAHWHPVAEQLAEERQELGRMVGDFIDAQMRTAPAADEDACLTHIKGACDGTTQDCAFTTDTGRANVLRVLVDRAARGVLNDHDATALRQRAEQVINGRETWKAKAEEIERDRDIHCAELEQAQAAIERVRAVVAGRANPTAAGISDHAIGQYDMAVAVLAALDGTEPTTAAELPDVETLAELFEGFGRLLATSSRDWGQYAPDAWLYAVILGWDCEQHEHDETCTHGAMEEMQQRHGWDDDAVAKARRYRAAVRALTKD